MQTVLKVKAQVLVPCVYATPVPEWPVQSVKQESGHKQEEELSTTRYPKILNKLGTRDIPTSMQRQNST